MKEFRLGDVIERAMESGANQDRIEIALMVAHDEHAAELWYVPSAIHVEVEQQPRQEPRRPAQREPQR